MDTIVIVGASLAGGRAVETLRQEGFDGRIVLVGAEPERPYERPPLSKEYLWGEATADDTYLRPQEYYAEQAIELRLGKPATRLLPASARVRSVSTPVRSAPGTARRRGEAPVAISSRS